jgi:hypothetical protein
MSTAVSTTNYSVGMPDVYFCNTSVTSNTVTTTSAYADLKSLMNAIAVDASTAARVLYSLGNFEEASLTPEYTTLDHYISSNGSRVKDKSIVTEKNLTVTVSVDEISVKNLERFFMAVDDDSTAAAVLENVAAEGSALLVFRSAYGNNFIYVIPRCALISNGDFAFSGEAWIKAGLKLNILALTGFNPQTLTVTKATKPPGISDAPYGYIQVESSFGTFYHRTA